ncbi:pilus assembly protein [Georgenia sp. Z1344]|uniref:pilus assembly protein n=1 Tax=Georgenia sp. Z1344 TaxID=3416706 RepID=UPI003CF48D0C
MSRRAASTDRDPEAGSAIVEYLGVALLLLLPLIYLVVAISRIQAASYAAEGAAREAGRIVAQADDEASAAGPAAFAVELAFADQGFDVDGAGSLVITCEADPCHTPGARIDVEVTTVVALPLLPTSIAGVPTSMSVEARHLVLVEDHRGTG